MPGDFESAHLRLENFDTYGRPVGYATSGKGQEELFNCLRENPHRLNLGRIGLLLNGRSIAREDLSQILQTLDVWNGAIESRFNLKDTPVRVRSVRSAFHCGDFPMVAMTAVRLGEPETAINALFIQSPKNTWMPNGHNWQRANLPVYLPGNGGLLAAVAMMVSRKNNGVTDTPLKSRWMLRLIEADFATARKTNFGD